MIDHLSVGVSDMGKASTFYDAVFDALGGKRLVLMDSLAAYGRDRIEFLAMMPFDGGPSTGGNGTHIAFQATSEADVDAFYEAALANGGTCEGAPGTRPYPHAPVYAAYVRDPFGNKLEALSNGFAG